MWRATISLSLSTIYIEWYWKSESELYTRPHLAIHKRAEKRNIKWFSINVKFSWYHIPNTPRRGKKWTEIFKKINTNIYIFNSNSNSNHNNLKNKFSFDKNIWYKDDKAVFCQCPNVICYIEGKLRFSDFKYIKYLLLQDSLYWSNTETLWNCGAKFTLAWSFPNILSIQSSLTKGQRFVRMDQFWLTVTCTHCEIWKKLVVRKRKIIAVLIFSLRWTVSEVWLFAERDCIEWIQNSGQAI